MVMAMVMAMAMVMVMAMVMAMVANQNHQINISMMLNQDQKHLDSSYQVLKKEFLGNQLNVDDE